MAYYGAYPMGLYQPMQNQYQPMQMNQTAQPIVQAAQPGQQSAQSNFFCRPVASKEEALGVPVDFMGAPMFFPDLAHNVIYMKRFNTNTGAADVFEFHGRQVQASAPAPSFAPLDEFNAAKETIGQLKETIGRLQDEIERLKRPAGRAKKNDADE